VIELETKNKELHEDNAYMATELRRREKELSIQEA